MPRLGATLQTEQTTRAANTCALFLDNNNIGHSSKTLTIAVQNILKDANYDESTITDLRSSATVTKCQQTAMRTRHIIVATLWLCATLQYWREFIRLTTLADVSSNMGSVIIVASQRAKNNRQ